MTTLSRTRIEYSSGVAWPLVTGCDHGPEVCATSQRCWARSMAHRFHRDFTPTLHQELLGVSFPRKPSRVLVSFGGDMFSDWWTAGGTIRMWDWAHLLTTVLDRIALTPKHNFLFLTKRPENLSRFGWPANAWLGVSITGAETPERQAAMLAALLRVEGGHKWCSYEPMLGPLVVNPMLVEWLVCGAQSGSGAVRPELSWLEEAEGAADAMAVPVWLKRNLRKLYPDLPALEELPERMVK